MARISVSASLGAKLKFPKWDPRFDDFENVSPHASITIDREVVDAPNETLLIQGEQMYNICRKFVEERINEDIQTSKSKKPEKK